MAVSDFKEEFDAHQLSLNPIRERERDRRERGSERERERERHREEGKERERERKSVSRRQILFEIPFQEELRGVLQARGGAAPILE